MTGDLQTRELDFYAALLAAMLRCLPRRSYLAYGDELAGIYRDELIEMRKSAGMTAVRRRMPVLLADAGTAVCLEFVDASRRAWLAPHRFAAVALAAAGIVWGLTVVASVANARWAVAILEFSLPLTVILLLGLPALSLVASRVGAGPGNESQGRATMGASIAATATAWTIMTCHIVS